MTTHTIGTTNSAGCSPCTPEAHQRAVVAIEGIEDQQEDLIIDVIRIEELSQDRAQGLKFDGIYKGQSETYLVITDEDGHQRVFVNDESRALRFTLEDLTYFLTEGLKVYQLELHFRWADN